MKPSRINGSAPLRSAFLEAMSAVASTVTVVTTDGPAGRAGVTVSAMSSVSADGDLPMLLVCLHHRGSASAKTLANGVFCVNVLREDQAELADVFAGRHGPDRFEGLSPADWTLMSNGAPRLTSPLAAFACRIAAHQCMGTHHVIFGAVQEVFTAQCGAPLIYARRDYARLTRAGLSVPEADRAA